MITGIPREIADDERRVALTPAAAADLVESGYEVLVEEGAGAAAHLKDEAYRQAGARIADDRDAVWRDADIVVKIRAPRFDPTRQRHEADLLNPEAILIALLAPTQDDELIERLADTGATAFGLELVPRISRAQSMDVLTSMAGIAGYRAVIEAAYHSGRYLSAQMTAAGSTPPARVLVIGAGVAGLSASATAREMGAEVWAFDTREAVREQVESLGAKFLELPRDFDESGEGEGGYAREMGEAVLQAERELFTDRAAETDIIVTTASVPGKPAPMLVPEAAVDAMRPGSVIVDLAAAQGGNCELTTPDETVEHDGVTIIGASNITNRLATHASEYFAENVRNFLKLFGPPENFHIDTDDRIIRSMMVTRGKDVTWPPPEFEEPDRPPEPEPPPEEAAADSTATSSETPNETAAGPTDGGSAADETAGLTPLIAVVVAATAVLLTAGFLAPPSFVQHLTVFVLACFVGWQVIWNVTSSLHTPLMSVTNAISGIIVVGGLVQVSTGVGLPALLLGAAAITVASINIFGGFFVTQRMLGMFRSERGGDS